MYIAHMAAQATPLDERSGVLYGMIRIRNQGWTLAGDFKILPNGGLDAPFARVADGVQELAVLEAKSGAPNVRSLGSENSYQQGTFGYISDRAGAYLVQMKNGAGENWLPGVSRGLAQQFIDAADAGTIKSYVSFADAGRGNAKLPQLPGTRIKSVSETTLVPWNRPPL